jgi:hypothetical protein
MVKHGQIDVVNLKISFFRDELTEKMVKQITSQKIQNYLSNKLLCPEPITK